MDLLFGLLRILINIFQGQYCSMVKRNPFGYKYLLDEVRSTSTCWAALARMQVALRELSSGGVDLVKLVGEVVPPLVDAWLELLPAGERVGELFETHSQAAQLVRGHWGGRGERAEGLWGHGWQGYFGQHQELLGNMEARQNFLGARLGAGASYTGHGAGQ